MWQYDRVTDAVYDDGSTMINYDLSCGLDKLIRGMCQPCVITLGDIISYIINHCSAYIYINIVLDIVRQRQTDLLYCGLHATRRVYINSFGRCHCRNGLDVYENGLYPQ